MATRIIETSVRPARRRQASPGEPTRPRRGPAARLAAGRRRLRDADLTQRWTAGLVVVVVTAGTSLQLGRASVSPRPGADEGALVAAGWELRHTLGPGADTFTRPAPTAAPGHIAAWDALTGAFDRAPDAVTAGRQLMAVALVVTALLVWSLARRLGLARWPSLVALAVAALSPLAVDLHRTVQPANLAVPWFLAGLVLVSARHHRVTAARVAAGAVLAVAVLTEPLLVVALPGAAWQLWRTTRPSVRGRALALVGAAFAAVALPLWALASDGRLSPLGDGQVGGLGARAGRSAGDLFTLDPIAVVACAFALVVAAVALPRLRPLALTSSALVALALATGASAQAAVTCALPLAAVLLGAGAQELWAWTSAFRHAPRRTRAATVRPSPLVRVVDAAAPLALLGLVAAAVLAVPVWVGTHRDLAHDHAAPLRDAQSWVEANVAASDRVIVDDALWVDMVEAGFDPGSLAGYGRVATDWPDFDYVVATDAATAHDPAAAAARSVDGSDPVAVFGSGADRVEVRRIGASDAPLGLAAAGTALAANPALDLAPDAAARLRDGTVDERVMSTLATLADTRRLAVTAFPVPAAERRAGTAARAVDIGAVDGAPARGGDPGVIQLQAFFARQAPPYRPATVDLVPAEAGGLVLRVTFPVR